MNTLTVITSEGVKKFPVKQEDHDAVIKAIAFQPFVTVSVPVGPEVTE